MADPLSTFFGRPGPAAWNLLHGRGPGVALTTLADPEALAPRDRRTLAERRGVDGFLGGILNTIGDPLFLSAVALAFTFKIPTTARMYKLGKQFQRESGLMREMAEKIPWLGRFSRAISSAWTNFAGTRIPEKISEFERLDLTFRHKYLEKLGAAVKKYEGRGRVFNRDTDVLVGAHLDGLHAKAPTGFADKIEGPLLNRDLTKTDPVFKELVDDFRAAYDDVYKEIYLDANNQATIRAAIRNYRKGAIRNWKASLKAKGLEDETIKKAIRERFGAYKDDELLKGFMESHKGHYFNRALVRHDPTGVNNKLFEGYLVELQKLQKEHGAQAMAEEFMFGRYFGRHPSTTKALASSALYRKGRLLPYVNDIERLREMGLIEEKAYRGYRELWETRNRNSMAKTLGVSAEEAGTPIGMYSLSAESAAAEYIHQNAKMRAWTTSGIGADIMEEYGKLKSSNKANELAMANMLEDTYIPAMLGKMTPKAFERQVAWGERLKTATEWFDNPTIRKYLGDSTAVGIQKRLLSARGAPLIDPLSRKVADYLYTATLGGNLGSSARNLFQLVLTSGPVLGPKWLGKGMASYTERMENYIKYRVKGMDDEAAIAKAFAEYHESGIPGSILFDDSFYRVKEALDAGQIQKLHKGSWEKVRSALMAPFQWTERSNRFITFDAALQKTLAEGVSEEERRHLAAILRRDPAKFTTRDAAIHLAGRVAQDTQFVGGLANTPYWFTDVGPLWRMFSHFPLRYLESVKPGGTASRMLAGDQGRLAGNLSSLARTYLWSDLTAHGFMELFGTDVDESLITGALPDFDARGAFAPLPLRPPVLGIAGALVQDVANWEVNESRYIVPLTIPGGVAASRAVGLIPGGQEAAKFLQRRYVDYDRPSMDGRYPVYTGQQQLVGYLSPTQLFFMGTGLMERGSAIQTEQQGLRFLQKNGENISNLKREYIRSVVNGSMDRAHEIDTQFFNDYGTSVKMLVKEQDFERYYKNMEVTRLEKVLEQMPPELRPQFAEAIQTYLLSGDPTLLGLTGPGLAGGMTIRERDPFRHRLYNSTEKAKLKYPIGLGYSHGPPEHRGTSGIGGGVGQGLGVFRQGGQTPYDGRLSPFGGLNPSAVSNTQPRSPAGGQPVFDSFSAFSLGQ